MSGFHTGPLISINNTTYVHNPQNVHYLIPGYHSLSVVFFYLIQCMMTCNKATVLVVVGDSEIMALCSASINSN